MMHLTSSSRNLFCLHNIDVKRSGKLVKCESLSFSSIFRTLSIEYKQLVKVIAWFVVIFSINTTSDISKLLYVISRAVRRVKFETKNFEYHEWYLCQISRTNHAIICLYYYPQRFWIFTCKYFKLSWNTTALSLSNCRNFSCSSIQRP